MSKPGKFVIPMLVATPLLLLLAQCRYGELRPILIGKKIWLEDDNAPLQQSMRGKIPIGSSITEARNILELNGFTCESPKEANPEAASKTNRIHEEAEHSLFCQLNGSHLFLITYNSSIQYKHEIVTEVNAWINVTGP